MKKEQLEKFEQLGTTEIEEQAGEFQVEVMLVFTQYPAKWFTQMHFVSICEKSNPFVNKTLNKLGNWKLGDSQQTGLGLIKRERRGARFHYQLLPRKPRTNQ
tara:strand:- start:2075 stop:2380 length:306 start_codon:yes stop_codon:yes gene_type:complete